MKNRVAELRKERGMSQNELAEKAGICRPYLSQIETHRQKVVGSEVMFNLAKALGVKYEEILYPDCSVYRTITKEGDEDA